MLNFIALHIMNWLVFGSDSHWHDDLNQGFPAGRIVPESAQRPTMWGRADIGVLIAVGVAVFLWIIIRWSRWGFELRVIGDSPRAAAAHEARGIPLDVVMRGFAAGLAEVERSYDVDLQLIAEINRTIDPSESVEFVRALEQYRNDVPLIAIGMDMQEEGYPASRHIEAYRLAKEPATTQRRTRARPEPPISGRR